MHFIYVELLYLKEKSCISKAYRCIPEPSIHFATQLPIICKNIMHCGIVSFICLLNMSWSQDEKIDKGLKLTLSAYLQL